jgi:hypothetical protein
LQLTEMNPENAVTVITEPEHGSGKMKVQQGLII